MWTCAGRPHISCRNPLGAGNGPTLVAYWFLTDVFIYGLAVYKRWQNRDVCGTETCQNVPVWSAEKSPLLCVSSCRVCLRLCVDVLLSRLCTIVASPPRLQGLGGDKDDDCYRPPTRQSAEHGTLVTVCRVYQLTSAQTSWSRRVPLDRFCHTRVRHTPHHGRLYTSLDLTWRKPIPGTNTAVQARSYNHNVFQLVIPLGTRVMHLRYIFPENLLVGGLFEAPPSRYGYAFPVRDSIWPYLR